MPQENSQQTKKDQNPPPFKPANPIQQLPQIKQFKLPKPVRIGVKKKVPRWALILVGGLGVLAMIILFFLTTGIINLPGTQEGKSSTSTKVATPSGTKNGQKSACQIYTRKGAASKANRNSPREGDREVTLKFREGSEVRLRNGKFVSLCGEDLSQINNLLSIYSNLSTKRSFTQSEEELAAEFEAAKQNYPSVADLNLFYRVTLPEGTPLSAVEYLINKLNEFSVVEIAYPEPQPATPP